MYDSDLLVIDMSFLQCFDAVGWVIWPVKIVPEMTYKVSSGTLNLCSLAHDRHVLSLFGWYSVTDFVCRQAVSDDLHGCCPIFRSHTQRCSVLGTWHGGMLLLHDSVEAVLFAELCY